MAISPISNAIYVNQNTPAAASVQSDFQSKLDMQMAMNAAASAEKKKEVEEVRPTEETYKIDPENEHEKQTQKEDLNEQNHKRKRSDDEVDDDSEDVKFQKLDIVV
ncbi:MULTISPECIES: hypothetical protein [Campylobacter]|uniref:Uncharacterized protein n=1 Tax=Campylobacter porcelli TaxID=1660073 RepID=A0ABU7M5U9_9BACT|nr:MULTISPECIES: hypothetical protein [unclassified Campylobacter]MCR8679129.1 hypothetical protein [Campylobacter sp. RM19072]MCR8696045.1 hypothetical protein [Campylobacter sp. RM19073]MEE3744673.1 hypothetical protein [Campylobacter sp. CX2-4855-23]